MTGEGTEPVGDVADRDDGVDWLAREVSIRGTHFRISKLLPMQAYHTLEILRPALLGSLDSNFGIAQLAVGSWMQAAGMDADQTKIMLATALLNAPPGQVDRVRTALFKKVFFTSSTHPTATPVGGNEAGAFNGLRASHVYELLLRAGCVNFTESFSDLISLASGRTETSPM